MTYSQCPDGKASADQADPAALARNDATAAATLTRLLSTMDPASTPADPDVVDAAMQWAQVRTGVDDAPPAAVAWAQYAHTAASQLYGWQNDTTVRAARILAAAHWARGEYVEASDTYSTVVAVLFDTSLDDAYHVSAQGDSAAHAAGRCSQAIMNLTACWQAWQDTHDATDPAGLDLVYRLTAMLAACGRLGEARQRFRDALPALPLPGTPQRDHERRRAAVLLDQATALHELACQYRRGARYRRRRISIAAVRPTDCAELLP